MKIEIAEPGRMTQSGSSLLKLIQNNNMPILDLLVRESIQNSLDAKNENDSYVTVEFFTGEFNKLALNSELEGIKESLNKKYWKNEYKYTNTNGVYSLEEYVRKSEMADHTSWGDFSMGNNNPRIISKVQAQVNSKISKEFSVEEEDTTSRLNSGLGKMFGDLLLPPENFGKKPSGGSGGGQGGNGHTETHKNIIFGYDPSKTKYFSNGMVVKLTIKSRGKISSAGINLVIDSETGAIKPKDWEEKMGLSMPFAIDSTEIVITKLVYCIIDI